MCGIIGRSVINNENENQQVQPLDNIQIAEARTPKSGVMTVPQYQLVNT